MTDWIDIEDLHVHTILGINDWERHEKQEILITLRLFVDTRSAGASDRIEDAVNYRSVCKRVIEMAEDSEFFLVEKLAEEAARICVSEFGVPRVRVQVSKPGALRFARSVGVTIERTSADYEK